MGTVCKYFLTNTCRYGDRCRYSHILPSENYRSSPYVYDARQKNEGVSVMHRLSSLQSGSKSINNNTASIDELDRLMPEYLRKITEDVNQIEQQHMWPLTCYSFANSYGNLLGWNDLSMEEVRWEAYQAQANGTMPVYLGKMQELLAQAKELRHIYIKPTKETENILKEHIRGSSNPINTSTDNQNVPFSFKPTTTSSSNFSFASAFDQPTSSVFNQSPISNTSGIFSQNNQQTTFNQFPQQRPQTFFNGRSTFGNTTSSSTGFFQEPSSFSSMDIGAAGSFTSAGSFNFGSEHNSMPISNKSAFGNNSDAINVSVYSRVEDLKEEDHEAFKANTFTLENIPFVPPPEELCK